MLAVIPEYQRFLNPKIYPKKLVESVDSLYPKKLVESADFLQAPLKWVDLYPANSTKFPGYELFRTCSHGSIQLYAWFIHDLTKVDRINKLSM